MKCAASACGDGSPRLLQPATDRILLLRARSFRPKARTLFFHFVLEPDNAPGTASRLIVRVISHVSKVLPWVSLE